MTFSRLLKTTFAAALAVIVTSATSYAEDLLIGVPVPLTGGLSQAGRLVLGGVELAASEINRNGGILGRKVKLVVDDTKSEANASAMVATKMVTQDKVYAFVGGFGSTADYALLQSIKRYQPIFIHAASQSVKLEKGFGDQPWYFHVYIWDYHRQKGVVKFLESLSPKPKTVAIAYEDGLFGTDAARYAKDFLEPAGFKIVMQEPFKTGTADFSPILNRIKNLDPDVTYVIGYAGDGIQINRQVKELAVNPKFMLYTESGAKREDFGEAGVNAAFIQDYAPEQRTPRNADFVKLMQKERPDLLPARSSAALGYTGLMTLKESIEAAKSFDRDAVLRELSSRTFDTVFGSVKYGPSPGGAKHQLLSEDNEIVVQFRANNGVDVVWPQAAATGKLVYPLR
jgi:branched-chain amino acid transport system substrate-binding protein